MSLLSRRSENVSCNVRATEFPLPLSFAGQVLEDVGQSGLVVVRHCRLCGTDIVRRKPPFEKPRRPHGESIRDLKNTRIGDNSPYFKYLGRCLIGAPVKAQRRLPRFFLAGVLQLLVDSIISPTGLVPCAGLGRRRSEAIGKWRKTPHIFIYFCHLRKTLTAIPELLPRPLRAFANRRGNVFIISQGRKLRPRSLEAARRIRDYGRWRRKYNLIASLPSRTKGVYFMQGFFNATSLYRQRS